MKYKFKCGYLRNKNSHCGELWNKGKLIASCSDLLPDAARTQFWVDAVKRLIGLRGN